MTDQPSVEAQKVAGATPEARELVAELRKMYVEPGPGSIIFYINDPAAAELIDASVAQAVAASRQPPMSEEDAKRLAEIDELLALTGTPERTTASDTYSSLLTQLKFMRRLLDTASERAKPEAGDLERAKTFRSRIIFAANEGTTVRRIVDSDSFVQELAAALAEARRAGESAMREVEMEADQAIQFAIGWIGGLPTSLPASFEDKFAAQKALSDTLGRIRALTPEPEGRS